MRYCKVIKFEKKEKKKGNGFIINQIQKNFTKINYSQKLDTNKQK